jgi:hypothetical protein
MIMIYTRNTFLVNKSCLSLTLHDLDLFVPQRWPRPRSPGSAANGLMIWDSVNLGHFHRGPGVRSWAKVSCHYNLYAGELAPRERSWQKLQKSSCNFC